MTQRAVGEDESGLGNAPHHARDESGQNTFQMNVRTIPFVNDVDGIIEDRGEENARVHGEDVIETVVRRTRILVISMILNVGARSEDKAEEDPRDQGENGANDTHLDRNGWDRVRLARLDRSVGLQAIGRG